jgi:hypothetical protein
MDIRKKNNAKRYLLALLMKYISPKVGIGRDYWSPWTLKRLSIAFLTAICLKF